MDNLVKQMTIQRLMSQGMTRDQAREHLGLEVRRANRSKQNPLPTVRSWRCKCGRLIVYNRCLACEADAYKRVSMASKRRHKSSL